MSAQQDQAGVSAHGIAHARSGRWTEYFAACAVAFTAFCLYLFCLAPNVSTGGDCGELIAASYRLGIAHPSGYALYCVVGKIFATLLPFGEVAWRYNLLSAICGAATCGVVTLLVSRLLVRCNPLDTALFRPTLFWPACCAGLLLAGMTFFGAQALIAEVYTPTGLMVALLFLSAEKWEREPLLKNLATLALLLGLSLNLHLSLLFLWPGLFSFFFLKWRENKSPRPQRSAGLQAVKVGLCFLLGFSVTLYLPLRAAAYPDLVVEKIGGEEYTWGQTLNWGHPVDFPRWKAHILVQQYKSLLWEKRKVSIFGIEFESRTFTKTPQGASEQLLRLVGYLSLQLLACTPLVLVGAIQSWRKQSSISRAFASFLALTFLINVFIAIQYRVDNIFDIVNFLFPAYVVIGIWLGLGIAWLLGSLTRWGEALDRRKSLDSVLWRWRFLTIGRLFLIGTIVAQWAFFVQTSSWRGNTRVLEATILRAEAAEKLQRQTGRPAALLLATDDTLFPFWYVQKVLNRAPQAYTPWGAAMHAYEDQHKVPQLAARLLKQGPVAMAQWLPDVDAKFPYQPLTVNGNLWQLTTGALPLPAQSLEERGAAELSGVRAKFLEKRVKRDELVGLQIDFPMPVVQNRRLLPVDRARQSMQVGSAEILVVPRALPAGYERAPTQDEMMAGKTPAIWKQSRRLIVPLGAKTGQMLRTVLPCQFSTDLWPGEYAVWVRIVPLGNKPGNKPKISWKKVDSMRLVVR